MGLQSRLRAIPAPAAIFVSIQRVGLGAALTATILAMLWGGNVVALKVGLATIPPFWSAFWRMLTGIGFVTLYAKTRGVGLRPQSGETRDLVTVGLMFAVQISALNGGTNLTSPAYAVVLLNSYPLFTNLIAHFIVAEDRLSARRIIALAVAFTGVCLVFLGKPEEVLAPKPALGNLIILISALLLSARTVYTQRVVQRIPPVRTVFWQMIVSMPVFLAGAALTEPVLLGPVNFRAIAAVLYQGALVAGVCFILWATLLSRHSPGAISMYAFFTPIFGVLASAWIFDEPVTLRLIGGLALVTTGILVASRQVNLPQPEPEKVARI